jgi:hypothetical protein
VGLDRAAILPLRRITANFLTTQPDGTIVSLGEGFDLSVEGRQVDRDGLGGELRRTMERWEPILRLVNEQIVRRILIDLLRPFGKAGEYHRVEAASLPARYTGYTDGPRAS